MKIKKIGHCCLVIEKQELKIITDPGSFNPSPASERGIDAIVITHEHADHLHIESVMQILKNNPKSVIITNSSVGRLLKKKNIGFVLVEEGDNFTLKGLNIEGQGNVHEQIYKTIPPVQNTGYFIGRRLFYPGDAFFVPEQKVEILAVPVAGPWLKISEAIDYALKVRPKKCFPVHDGMLRTNLPNFSQFVVGSALRSTPIEFVEMVSGSESIF